MNRNAEALLEQAGAYAHLFDRVSIGGRFDGAPSTGPARLLTDQELVQALAANARSVRLAQAEQVMLAGEVARRSEPNDETSLARRMGTSSPADLVSQVTGVPRAHAGTIVASGEAFRPRESMTGEPLPAVHAHRSPARSPTGCSTRRSQPRCAEPSRKAAPGLAPWEVDKLETQILAFAAEGLGPRDAAGLRAEGARARAPRRWRTRTRTNRHLIQTVKRKALSNGLIQWTLLIDALTDGFLKTAIDANSTLDRPILVTPDQPQPDPETTDRRPLAQRRVDGLRLLAKKALKMDDGQVGGTAVTMLVTLTEEALRSGLGKAQLPDCGTDIPASIARILAADAEIIPVVLGGKSQPLDLGVGRRFFSEAQRRAMADPRRRLRRPGLHRTTFVVRRRPHQTRRVRTHLVGQRCPPLLEVPPAPRPARLADPTHGRPVVVDPTTLGRPHRQDSAPADASHPSTSPTDASTPRIIAPRWMRCCSGPLG